MKLFSAQYIFTNDGPPLRRGIVSTEDDGTIISIENTAGKFEEKRSLEFYNGIIVPGFVNCHCHLELSHLKGTVARGKGLSSFIGEIRETRQKSDEAIIASAGSADREMHNGGVVLCADICNSIHSFSIKKNSRISYLSLLEVFGIDPEKSSVRMDEIKKVAETAFEMNLPFYIVPHSFYSMSLTLLRLLREKSKNNKVTSIHFLETEGEKTFIEDHSGPILESYKRSGIVPSVMETINNLAEAVVNEIAPSGNLILVHNTFADRDSIRKIMKRKNVYWCLCPNSNIYIENKIPPLDLLMEEGCEIVIGTDSLASNRMLNILEELKTLQLNFPMVSIETLIGWATSNGAKALGEESRFGKIEIGKKPGLLLIQDVDLINMKLLPESFVKRLI
jgi:cytosine/adenosine deaminase-related metal-dependent hydrolase